ncbi:hypothetical protein, partial [Lysobacter sp. Root690]|uniref:hypothetical protein n=1 Tax=Lysobacter sp. Root690 TaxID=1736588 RepID=UPI001F28237C
DILSRWRTAHIHVRRPTGVLLLTRVNGFAALDELRGFELKQKLQGLSVGAASYWIPFGHKPRPRTHINLATTRC